MKKTDNILTTGIITQQHSRELYRVKLINGTEIPCWIVNRFRITDGKKKKRPRIFVGDEVKVEIHPQDFTKGMLVGFVRKKGSIV